MTQENYKIKWQNESKQEKKNMKNQENKGKKILKI